MPEPEPEAHVRARRAAVGLLLPAQAETRPKPRCAARWGAVGVGRGGRVTVQELDGADPASPRLDLSSLLRLRRAMAP